MRRGPKRETQRVLAEGAAGHIKSEVHTQVTRYQWARHRQRTAEGTVPAGLQSLRVAQK